LHKGIVFQFHLLLQVQFISRLEHNNVVQLLSYCIEGNVRGLVYEYSSRGSLHDILHGKKGAVGAQPGQALSWAQRVSIALSSAEGLEFINEKAEHCITHRIIKSRNILLFDNDVAKVIGDFGVFKSNPDDKINPDPLYYLIPPDDFDGYGAPELLMTGEFSNKSEVFSFGVVLLELLTGRKARDRTQPCAQQDLLSWARPRLATRRVHKYADPRLGGEYPPKDFAKMADIASRCLEYEEHSRPSMSMVVKDLRTLLPGILGTASGARGERGLLRLANILL
jgi:pto-interacting protein 1